MFLIGSLAARCRGHFTSRTVERGRHYARAGRVTLTPVSAGLSGILGEVRGSRREPYHVEIDWDEATGGAVASCDCPVGAQLVLCKHVYAALLEADRSGDHEGMFPANDPLALGVDADPFGDLTERGGHFWSEPPGKGGSDASPPASNNTRSTWRPLMDAVAADRQSDRPVALPVRATKKLLEYHLEAGHGDLRVSLHWRNVLKSKRLGKVRPAAISELERQSLDAEDREVIAIARGCEEIEGPGRQYPSYGYGYTYGRNRRNLEGFVVRPALATQLLPKLCATGRFGMAPPDADRKTSAVASENGSLQVLHWDANDYQLVLLIGAGAPAGGLRLRGVLRGRDIEVALEDVRTICKGGIVIFDDRLAMAVDQRGSADDDAWLRQLWSSGGVITVPGRDVAAFMSVLAETAQIPDLEIATEVDWKLSRPTPQPLVRFFETGGRNKKIGAQLWFVYSASRGEQEVVRFGSVASAACCAEAFELVLRDAQCEQTAREQLTDLGFSVPSASLDRRYFPRGGADVALDAEGFVNVARSLIEAGWQVEAEGKRLRAGLRPSIRISSGVDWFELSVAGQVDEASLALPELLRAIKRRDGFVTLSDGSRGILPEDWLDRYGSLTQLGDLSSDGERLKMSRGAGVLLDAMLAAHGDVAVDAGYAKFRSELRRFDRVRPVQPPRAFQGVLRDYQALGLGWLKMLARFGLGGCLADDMGLGKTVQVLALIATKVRKPCGPTLVVAPKSLVFNWLDEAARFAPKLRAASYTGARRSEVLAKFDRLDLVITTYGTVLRDIQELCKHEFRYVVLDEASAIKNPSSLTAKSCRLLKASHRLALTGTPVENRLDDLASILEFLNPGMTSTVSALESLAQPTASAGELAALGRALKPVMLRRTKAAVLSELPDKTEQVMRCELGPAQRKLYDELRDHYRALLDRTIDKQGLARSKIHVLEALLRLRQAACHPGLLDDTRRAEPSAKLDALMGPLVEVTEAGHKVLVFSQFTSFLSIARDRLDEAGVSYAYLDGKTRRRKEQVERFQNDDDCSAFLISLKAGGHGLNLTAAEYVFLLDPWWNPATEAQAIDRAHRIGQQRPVFAYRMIADNTVEDRVLELQTRKRDLAEAIFAGQKSLIGALTVDDLELLLS